VRIGLRASAASGLATLTSWLPRAVKPGRATVVDALYSYVVGGPGPRAGTKRFHVLYRDARRVARSLNLDVIRRAFDRDLSLLIGERATRRVFVHAGVVGLGKKAVVLPGRSFSGKTTLIRALVDAGGVFYSDEFALLDSRGRVSPWAEPLSIRIAGPHKAGESHTPELLGWNPGRRPLPIGLVVMTSFQAGRRFRPRATSRSQGALGLLQNTLPARRRPRETLRVLAAAVADARVIQGPRGEAAAAARAIVKYLDGPTAA